VFETGSNTHVWSDKSAFVSYVPIPPNSRKIKTLGLKPEYPEVQVTLPGETSFLITSQTVLLKIDNFKS